VSNETWFQLVIPRLLQRTPRGGAYLARRRAAGSAECGRLAHGLVLKQVGLDRRSRYRSIATLLLCVDEHRQRTQTTLPNLVVHTRTS
jgi:hypothetical protein